MSISSMGGASTSAVLADLSASRSTRAEQMFTQMDTDQDGAVSKDELKAFSAKLEANRPAGSASGPKPPSPDEMFSKADQNGDASISLDELSSMMAEAETRAKAGAGNAGRHGPPPGGGAGGPPPGGAQGAQGKSESSKTTEPADTNKDGTVSAAEKLLYELTHGTTETS